MKQIREACKNEAQRTGKKQAEFAYVLVQKRTCVNFSSRMYHYISKNKFVLHKLSSIYDKRLLNNVQLRYAKKIKERISSLNKLLKMVNRCTQAGPMQLLQWQWLQRKYATSSTIEYQQLKIEKKRNEHESNIHIPIELHENKNTVPTNSPSLNRELITFIMGVKE